MIYQGCLLYNKFNVKSNYNPSFKGLGLATCIKDIRLANDVAPKVIDCLPPNLKSNRKNCINEAVDFIRTRDFYKSTLNKNWLDKEEALWAMEYTKVEGFLEERADTLIAKAYLELKNIYKNADTIIIPFSGGRDSSSLLASSLAFFPNKKYKLITVLNGFSKKQENVREQIEYIKSLFGNGKSLNIEHIVIDASENFKKFVIDPAKQDERMLHAPAICSSCKMVMEKEIWNYLLKSKQSLWEMFKGSKRPILMGYTSNQRNQSWMEQTITQIEIMKNEGAKNGINTLSPFFDVIEEPYDSTLLLSSLGIPLKHHKLEMKCLASGLNPRNLDTELQNIFTIRKNIQTREIVPSLSGIFYYNPNVNIRTKIDLSADIEKLKLDKEFTQGAF